MIDAPKTVIGHTAQTTFRGQDQGLRKKGLNRSEENNETQMEGGEEKLILELC